MEELPEFRKENDEESTVAELHEKWEALMKNDPAFYDTIADFAEKLQEKYPDCADYRLYHLFIGSTPHGECSKFGFPGEDSVQDFIEREFERLGNSAA